MTENETLKKALFTIKKLKQRLEEQPRTSLPIAIIGLSCRLPQVLNKDEYWELLCQGKNIISKIPEERWQLLAGTDEIKLRDQNHPYWGGYMSNISKFDAYFFGISPREAIPMDPQQRMLLEVSYEALEDAGLPMEKLSGSNMGVFASLYISQLAHMQHIENDLDALYLPTGNVLNMAPNRISYLYDLRGPSLVVDSSCSSSMAALNLACLNLQNNLCDTALVSAARLNLLPYINYVLSKAKMLSPDGQCKTFDASANGYALGEGIGAIVLKPLKKALQDNDRIYAVICGSSINQDGKTNGLTAPNGLQQVNYLKQLIRTLILIHVMYLMLSAMEPAHCLVIL
jgi:acyl transferase domain-containing protein